MQLEYWRNTVLSTLLVLPLLFINQHCTASNNVTESDTIYGERTMQIRFVFDDRTVTAMLNDSPSTQDFIAQLPLTLELEDYANTEKIAYLPSKLTKEGAPASVSSKVGDISYYAPGLINLGKIDGDVSRFISGDSMKVTIEVFE
ncbi:cyclophilin-like fold protein [Vibrio alginolyticus]|uniref:cyclophilin-like fold protein n=1 Tax=Vibrio alginolyticus TaxID=663 RepID=UPI00215F5FAC|nr:cyclophilin-like fold protein [Vibrio alginolyticus]MCS0251440.1 cyclophilin-like fold protein [Vibrio alginolyticus]